MVAVDQPFCDLPVRKLLQAEGVPQQTAADFKRAAGEGAGVPGFLDIRS